MQQHLGIRLQDMKLNNKELSTQSTAVSVSGKRLKRDFVSFPETNWVMSRGRATSSEGWAGRQAPLAWQEVLQEVAAALGYQAWGERCWGHQDVTPGSEQEGKERALRRLLCAMGRPLAGTSSVGRTRNQPGNGLKKIACTGDAYCWCELGQAKKKLFSTIETCWALVRGRVMYHTRDVCHLPAGLTMPLLGLNPMR